MWYWWKNRPADQWNWARSIQQPLALGTACHLEPGCCWELSWCSKLCFPVEHKSSRRMLADQAILWPWCRETDRNKPAVPSHNSRRPSTAMSDCGFYYWFMCCSIQSRPNSAALEPLQNELTRAQTLSFLPSIFLLKHFMRPPRCNPIEIQVAQLQVCCWWDLAAALTSSTVIHWSSARRLCPLLLPSFYLYGHLEISSSLGL